MSLTALRYLTLFITNLIFLPIGLLYKPDEALRIGLIDEVVHPSELLNAARKQMSNWLQVPGN